MVDSQQAADGSVQLNAMCLKTDKLQEQVDDVKNIVLGFVFVMFVFLIFKYEFGLWNEIAVAFVTFGIPVISTIYHVFQIFHIEMEFIWQIKW